MEHGHASIEIWFMMTQWELARTSARYVIMTDRNSEPNSPDLPIWEQYVPLAYRNSEKNSPNLPIGTVCSIDR